MRTCIVGGGLAGSLLAWRLAQAAGGWDIDLLPGELVPGDPVLGERRADATAASGGAVRAYEPHAEQRRLAAASMAELLASPTLREWAGYRRGGSVYLRHGAVGLDAEVADIERMLPGSVRLAPAAELARDGWAGVPAGAVGVRERCAGHVSPVRLRDSVLADAAVRRRVSVANGAATAIAPTGAGTVTVTVGAAGQSRKYDVVVVAAGAWTPALLRSCGLPAGGFRTKSIQYGLYPAGDWRPPQFVDEATGLYGRPTEDGGLLLGLATEQWEVDPDRPPSTPALHEAAARLARDRFPRLRIGPRTRTVGSADCYADQPILSLRPVADTEHRLFTFTGGAGGSVKTALAASHRAATQLVESGHTTDLVSVGFRKG